MVHPTSLASGIEKKPRPLKHHARMSTTTGRPWHIIHSESEIGWGGQEHRILAELSGFQRRGCSVALLAPAHSLIAQRAATAGILVRHWRVEKLLYPLTIAQTALWFRRVRPDVVNTHSSRDTWLAGIAARLARVPLVIRTRHIDVSYPNRWLSRHAYTSLADHVMTTSEKISAHFRDFFDLASDRVSTVPTGIDLERFSSTGEKAELLPSSGGAGPPVVGMVSVLRSWKGHETFLKAARRLRDERFPCRFVIVGEGGHRATIEALIAELKLSTDVTLTGHREDVPAVLRSLDALVIASTRHEGVPQIGLQALATRTPVIGSDAGGTPEIIRDGETGRVFPAGDAAALARAIRETLTDKAASRALAERGRTAVEARHGIESMLDTLDALYRRHLTSTR